MDKLRKLIEQAKWYITHYIEDQGSSKRRDVERYTIHLLNMKEHKDGTVSHITKPIHPLAFIMAYKELESQGRLKITRPPDVPFPMTDWETLFSLCG